MSRMKAKSLPSITGVSARTMAAPHLRRTASGVRREHAASHADGVGWSEEEAECGRRARQPQVRGQPAHSVPDLRQEKEAEASGDEEAIGGSGASISGRETAAGLEGLVSGFPTSDEEVCGRRDHQALPTGAGGQQLCCGKGGSDGKAVAAHDVWRDRASERL